ncbi:bilirubin oxidase [Coniochaeta sp. 2T2.1]|nr:bilirubin oxidase [Coniochaeta sp. 2T2.1]
MTRLSLACQSLAILVCLATDVLAKDWLSPEYKWLYQYTLPIPPIKQEKWPATPIYNPVTGNKIKYYEIEIKEFKHQVYPNLKVTTLVGYDGISPGPTFLEEKGTESVVRFTNHGKMATSVHLHGSYSRSAFDGWAEDITKPGEYKDYYYPNHQNGRMLWYHDHAIDHTAENAYFGQAGAYILHDSAEDGLGLPSGYGQYDIPLVLSAKQYNSDGSLYSPANEDDSLFGDIIHVNGQPWPYLAVEPRKYRLRFLNAAISRTFFLYFESSKKAGEKQEFNVIASDAGLLTSPQKVKDLYISMAERYEVVVDFSKFKGENVTLRNTKAFAPDKDFLHTDKVMRFVVGDKSVDDPSQLPSTLRNVPFPTHKTGVDQHFLFHRSGSEWRINGITFADVKNRVLAKPKRGTVEVWELENSSGGGWSHPIHIHLVDFRVIKRVNGRGKVMPYEDTGLKDVVWLGPGETVTVEAHYAPWPGVYMFHCHNLIHEDHEMMAAFNVSVLADFGYDETNYIDPMETEWRAKKEDSSAYGYDACKSRIEFMASFQPYNHADEVDGWLDDYWKTYTPKGTASASASANAIAASASASSTAAAGTGSVAAAEAVVTSSAAAAGVTASATITPKPTTTSTKTTKTTSSTSTKKRNKKDVFVRYHARDVEMPRRTANP